MRPFRSFLLLLIFLTCFAGLYFIIPGFIQLPGINDFIPVNITEKLVKKKPVPLSPDTASAGNTKKTIPDTVKIPFRDSANLKVHISVPIARVIDSLQSSKGQVRIMYYGDSQIEGDRITSFLRHALRKGKGGTGPGLFLPLMPVMYTRSLYVRSSSNWKRYNYLSYRNHEIGTRDLGPFMTVCRYLPPATRSIERVKASVRIVPSVLADSSTARYEQLRIILKNDQGPVNIKIYDGDRIFYSDTVNASVTIKEISVNVNGSVDIQIEFDGFVSPDIYCMSLESNKGVVIDNIAQRGSAGMEFTMVEKENLREIYEKLKPQLFILNFGLNVVHNIREDYTYYENGLLRQINLLKEICPGTEILIISLTDMAFRDRDSIKSFPNIPKIRDAQKSAARKAGVSFWDSYLAMGGENSSVIWSEKKPPLMQKDYVHFTNTGADSISKLLIQSMFVTGKFDAVVKATTLHSADSLTKIMAVSTTSLKIPVKKDNLLKAIISDVFNYNPEKPFIFTTAAFWIFLLVVLAGYSLIYRKLVLRNTYLLLISLFFYFKTGGLFLFLLIFVTTVDYSCGLLINKAEGKAGRKFFLILSLVSNLGLLAYFKYSELIVDTFNNFFGTELKVYDILSSFSNSLLGTNFDISFIILPVGISFFTFQSLSYTIDVYKRKMEPVRNIMDFGFYVSFFPHLVAGPIVRASVFMPQIYQEFHLTKREFSHALFMISKGLIKKIIISNFIAINFVDRVFDAPGLYSGFENLMAIYGYGLQIYCDFSGYTDIAIGVALIIGFRLPVNFNSPYKAVSITDFWKRWHMSLSQWLKDYLYVSLGGNRKGKFRTYINLMLTMLLGGLWHGASLRYVIWGALHGFGLVINRIWSSVVGSRLNSGRFGRIAGIILTFNFVSFCWIFFRAENMESVITMLRQIGQNFYPGSYSAILPAYGNVFILMMLGYIIHLLPEKIKESYRGVFIRIPLALQLLAVMIIAVMLYQMKSTEIMPFIYFRF
jgi:alginate O-acetyltransferase complex protein AlgI